MAATAVSRGYGDDPTIVLSDVHSIEGEPEVTRFAVATKTVTDENVKCQNQVPIPHEPGEFKACGKLLAELVGRPWLLRCPRCKAPNRSPE